MKSNIVDEFLKLAEVVGYPIDGFDEDALEKARQYATQPCPVKFREMTCDEFAARHHVIPEFTMMGEIFGCGTKRSKNEM